MPTLRAPDLQAALRVHLGESVTVTADPLSDAFRIDRVTFDRFTGQRLCQRHLLSVHTIMDVGEVPTSMVQAIAELFLEQDPVEQEIERRVREREVERRFPSGINSVARGQASLDYVAPATFGQLPAPDPVPLLPLPSVEADFRKLFKTNYTKPARAVKQEPLSKSVYDCLAEDVS